MRNKIIVFLIVLFFSNYTVSSQKVDTYSQTLKERIFMSYNSSFFLTQENLLYKVFCIRDRNNRFSNLSKVAYVELVDKDKKTIFKHKLILNNGVADGSFFIPKSTMSGNYKLIAYTQWMRNEGTNYFFQGDITIVNIFVNNQVITLNNADKIKGKTSETKEVNNKLNIDKNNFLMLNLDKKEYSKRDKVEFRIKSLDEQKSLGEYSISVRKINSINKPRKYTPKNYLSLYHEKAPNNNLLKKKAEFMLDYKGDLLYGKVRFRDTEKPVTDVKVMLSSPTNKYPLRLTTTNSTGKFEFLFKENREELRTVVQVLDKNREDYSLSIFKNNLKNFDDLEFNDFEIDSDTKKILLPYSIQNQIENVYSHERYNILKKKENKKLNENTKEIYILDDYKRFATVREMVTEIIKNVRVVKRKKKYEFHVDNIDFYDEDKSLPFIFVDGVLIQDQNKFANYNANKIKKITVLRDKYTYKSVVFIGIIIIETFEGDFYENEFNSGYVKRVKLLERLNNKASYNIKYTDNLFDRIPDYRRQLYWEPHVYFIKKEKKFTFYTSDISGKYEICIEGFNQEGQPIFLKEIFSVN